MVAAGTTFSVVRFVRLLRVARESSRAFGDAVETVALGAERASARGEELSRGSARLERSLDELRASRARLQVLLTAWSESRAAIRSLVFIPRK